MKKKLFLTLPLMLLGAATFAQTVSEEEALGKALGFLSSQRHARGNNSDVRLTLAHKAAMQDETFYYVFNNQAGGFVIIGGDEVADDVLGYTENGSFDIDQLPANFRWWLSTYEQAISHSIRVQRANGGYATRGPKQARIALPNIPHLMQTQWNQDMPYNAMIPGNTPATPRRDQYATGCVATAVAQIMNYHQWPEHGWSSNKYQQNGFTYEADFQNTTYDWSLMQNTYSDTYTGSAAEMEVAKLMYHVGVSVGMVYGTIAVGGSASSTQIAAQKLVTNFGYKSGNFIDRSKISDADWENVIYNELANKRPVLYSGQSEDGGGHAFVCEGYENGKYYINWGWGGYCDGVYNLTPTSTEDALDPSGSGIGGAGEEETYKRDQRIAVGIEPDRSYDGSLNVIDVITPYGNGNYVTGEPFEIEFVVENSSSTTKTISDATLFFFSDGGDYKGYLDGTPDFDVKPHSTRNLKVTSGSATPDWMNNAQKQIVVLVDYLDESSYIQYDIEVFKKLDISYTLTDAGWGTICLPYEAEIPGDITAYVVTDVRDNGTLVRTEADKFETNKAYLISGTPDTYSFHGPDTPQGVYQNGLLHGVTKNTGEYAPMGSYALQNKPTEGLAFYQVNNAYSYRIKKYTAWLETPAPMGARIIIDDETGIHNVALDETEAIQMLNVLGQRTNATTGLVIKNGKLNFVK